MEFVTFIITYGKVVCGKLSTNLYSPRILDRWWWSSHLRKFPLQIGLGFRSSEVSKLEDSDWINILKLIKKDKCTLFIGAGTCAGVLPIGRDIANKWTNEYNYPLKDSDDLPMVAQFVAIEQYDILPKEEIIDQFEGVHPPDF